MKLAARYGFIGVAALAALSLTHWARAHRRPESEVALYLLGVLPNLLAAVATPFVFLGAWADRNSGADYVEARRWLALATTLSTAGLVGWEFVQQNSRKLVFDLHDIGSTLVGTCLAVALFRLATPRAVRSPTPKQLPTRPPDSAL